MRKKIMLTAELDSDAIEILRIALLRQLKLFEDIPRLAVANVILTGYQLRTPNPERSIASDFYWLFAGNPDLKPWAHIQKELDWLAIATRTCNYIRANLILHEAEIGTCFVLGGRSVCKRCQKIHGKIVRLVQRPTNQRVSKIISDIHADGKVWFGMVRSDNRESALLPCYRKLCDLTYHQIDPTIQEYSPKYGRISIKRTLESEALSKYLPKSFMAELEGLEAKSKMKENWAAHDRHKGIHRSDAYYFEKMRYYCGQCKAEDIPEKYRAEILSETERFGKRR